MRKISEIVKINSVLGSEVNLVEELFDKEKNALRMANYMPTKGHRDAFSKIIRGLYDEKDKRAYVLNGSYGTGKSNLLLMIANYLMNNSNSQDMERFFENYFAREIDEKIDDVTPNREEILQKIKQNISHLKIIRTTDKPHFIVLCKYDVSGDFTEILLRAIKEAFERESISTDNLDSIYREAIRKIAQWESAKNEADFHDKLHSELEKSNRTIEGFKKKLENIDGETLKEFKDIYKRLTLSDFTYDKDNLTDIIRETAKSNVFKEKYSGFTIFFDEFGNILKNHRFDELVFQRFTEFCQNSLSDRIPVLFVATTHKSFETYAGYYDKDQFKKVSDRFIDVSLSTEGFEDIISAIVRPDKESEIWKEKIEKSREFIEFSKKTTALRLFEGLKGRKLEDKLIKNLYPMHPMATYALLGLSKEVSSNNRSVYSFFTRGGFEPYIKETDFENDGKLNFYTADSLIGYFNRDKFKSDNSDLRAGLKDKIRNYESSRSEFEKFKRNEAIVDLKIYERVMDIMLIYQILEVEVTKENIYFGLNMRLEVQKKELENSIENLVKYGVVYYKKSAESYEFKQSDLMDVDGIIAEYIKDNLNKDMNIVEELKKLKDNRDYSLIKNALEKLTSRTEPLPKFHVDFQYQNEIIRVHDIESSSFLKARLAKIDRQDIFTYESDGYFFYVVCENSRERERALKAVENNQEKNLIFAIPKEIKELRKPLLGILAIEKSEKLKNLKPQEIVMLDAAKKGYRDEIISALNDLGKTTNLELFYQGKKSIIGGGNKEKTLITEILKERYDINLPSINLPLKQRRDDFNSEHEKSFKEFIERVIAIKEPILYDSKLAGRADDRYFKVLLDSQILSRYDINENGKEILGQSSSLQVYNCYPALKNVLEKLESENINLEELKHDLAQKYALGKYGMYFILSYIYRYFDGNVSFINSHGTNKEITSYRDIEEFSKIGKEIKKIRISEREKRFIISIYNLFKCVGTLNQKGNIEESFNAVKEWYNGLQKYQKIQTITVPEIAKIFEKINTLTADKFLLSELNILIGKGTDDSLSEEDFKNLLEKISKFKNSSEYLKESLFKNLLNEITKKFETQSDEVYQFFYKYYEELPEFKKNSSFEKHTQESRKLLSFLQGINKQSNYEELLLNYMDNYKEWVTDNTKLVVEALYKGYSDMEKLFLIPDPQIVFEGDYRQSGDTIYFGNNFKIIIENLNKKSYETYYTLTNDGESVIDSFGTSKIKIVGEKDEISNIKHGDILCILNQEDSVGTIKKRSNEIRFKFRSNEKRYEPTIEIKKTETYSKKPDIIQNIREEKIIFDIIPTQKNELKSSINGLIKAVKGKFQIKDEDIKEILQQLLAEYSRGK